MQKQMKLKLYGSEEMGNSDCEPTVRRLKVYYGSNKSTGYSRHALIRIAGKYLRDYGFKTGDFIQLKLSYGRIEITKTQPE